MKLEVVVVASALDDMYRLKDVLQLLAIVCPGDTDICRKLEYDGRPHVVSYNVIIFVPKTGTLPYLTVFLNSTF